jgi:cation diffusion facilitator CzcD-associated flavoprotein CzcO
MSVPKVAIIGAGPLGLGFAKALAAEPNAKEIFKAIDVFERRPQAGGLWNLTGDKSNVTVDLVESKTNKNAIKVIDNDPHLSPMYKHTETNIVKQMMRYKDYPLPEKSNTFPLRSEVLNYLVDYQKTIPDFVNFKFNTKVSSLLKNEDNNQWELKTTGSEEARNYDKVILAHGHFDTPFIPKAEGLLDWFHKDPTAVSHAKYYNDCTKFKNKKVLIIGNSASGIDISTQLITVADKIVMSCVGEPMFKGVIEDQTEQIDRVVKYDFDNNRSVTTASGKVISNIDTILFCTGYLYEIPFLKSYTTGPKAIITDGSNLRYLYKQLFYIPDPSLILAGLPKSIIPFPFAEAQGQYVARILSGRLQLPSTEEMYADYEREISERGDGSHFHVMGHLKDAEYCNEMYNLIKGTENEGFVANFWDEQMMDLRTKTGEVKRARFFELVKYANDLKAKGLPFVHLKQDKISSI